jgi:hypothetical protein
MLVVLHGATKVLNDVGRHAHSFQGLAVHIHRQIFEDNLATRASVSSTAICSWPISTGPERLIV